MIQTAPRTLLLCASHFYPSKMVAAVRWLHFAKALPGLGWRVVVLARDYGMSATDEQLLAEIGPGVIVRYIDHPADAQPIPSDATSGRSPEPAGARSKSAQLKASAMDALAKLVAVPDSSVRFWNGARARMLQEAERAGPDVIGATMPLWGKVGSAVWLARKLGRPLLLDLRDPYLIDPRFGPYGLRGVRAGAHRRFSAMMYREASLVLHTIPIDGRWARMRYPFARERIRTMTNGFPPTMLEGQIEPLLDAAGRRSIRVVGAMGDAETLQLARAIRQLVDRGEDLSLMLVGKPPESSPQVRELLGDRVEITGRVEHKRALAAILGADVLVNYIAEHRRHSFLLSTKLFEYAAAGKPVVEVNPSRSDRFFVRELPGVSVISDPTDAGLAETLHRALNGEGRPSEASRQALIREHAWPAKAVRLARWLDELAEGRPLSE